MNQREWWDHINDVRRKHFAEIEQLRRCHRDEIRRLYQMAAKAERTKGFSLSIMTSVDCGEAVELNDVYMLAS